jgi:hypothetical protein
MVALISAPILACGPSAPSQQERQSDKVSKDKKLVHSKLFAEFDLQSLLPICQAHFESVDEHGLRGDFQINKSPDTYKVFTVEGTISQEKLTKLLVDLKTDLFKKAKESGVVKLGEPSDKVEDRPISVLRAMYITRLIDPSSIRGFYLSYTDGKLAGAIDVIATMDSSAIDRWHLVCAVHEAVPE